MSQFSNQLQASIEAQNFTQTHVCEKADISQGQMSRYVNGENRPEPEMFERLLNLFPEKERIALILAYLQDDIPARFRKLVTVAPADAAANIKEEPPAYLSRMPRKLRAAYDYLGFAALEKPKVATTLINTAELVKSGT